MSRYTAIYHFTPAINGCEYFSRCFEPIDSNLRTISAVTKAISEFDAKLLSNEKSESVYHNILPYFTYYYAKNNTFKMLSQIISFNQFKQLKVKHIKTVTGYNTRNIYKKLKAQGITKINGQWEI